MNLLNPASPLRQVLRYTGALLLLALGMLLLRKKQNYD